MDGDIARSQLSAALARVAGGDRGALRMVYQDTSAKLFGVCLRILHDRPEAEDVLQEVYVTVWRRAATFDSARASPITWLVTIARNRSIDRLRSRASGGRSVAIDEAGEIADTTPTPEALAEMADTDRRLADCIAQLEARQATAIRAAFLDGFTYEELARRIGIPLGTMKSTIRRGLMRLRGCLEQ
jgi:RNA polymerase sigma factor (sigma-70 family)